VNRKTFFLLVLAMDLSWIQSATGQATTLRNAETTYRYDGFGNVTLETRKTGDGNVDTRAITYRYNPSEWLVAMPTESRASSSIPDGTTTIRRIQFVPDTITGAILYQIIEPNGSEETYNRMQYSRDAHGVLTGFRATDLSGQQQRGLSSQFDPLEDLFPTTVTNLLRQTQSLFVHPGLGVLVAVQDVNGAAHRWQYDGFGRLKQVSAPDGGSLSMTYKNIPSTGGIEIDARDGGGQSVSTLYDAFLNDVLMYTTSFDGRRIETHKAYDDQGHVVEIDGPCFGDTFACRDIAPNLYAYDHLGRLIAARHGEADGIKWTYSGLRSTRYDEVGNQRYADLDQLGRITNSAVINAGKVIKTAFDYGPFSLPSKITDTKGNITRLSYDVRGRVNDLRDPDSGNHSYKWTAFDEPSDERDGNGLNTTYIRDALGRVQTVTDKNGTANFTWDRAPNGIGKIANAISSDGVETGYAYDPKGHLVGATWRVDGSAYGFGFSYDAIGRIDSVTYPSLPGRTGFATEQKYNEFGFVYQVIDPRGHRVFWQADQQNERGETTLERLGNGSTTTRRGFDPRGRVTSIETTGQGVTQQSLAYSYYPTGSLKTRMDRLPSSTVQESFTFDRLDRLSEWKASTSPDTSTVPHDLLDQTFKYDDIGNLTRRMNSLGPQPNLSMRYGQRGAGPHALTQVNLSRYSYNAGGDQVSGRGRKMTYNAFNLPSTVRGPRANLSFKYDAGHQRALEKGSTQRTVVSAGGLYERRVQAGHTTDVYYVPAGGRLIAQVQSADVPDLNGTFFLHDDGLGSVQAVTNETGALLERLWYEPFGQHVDPANPEVTVTPAMKSVNDGFTGQFEDPDLRLINMKGRIYDPTVGHFLTPDPLIQDPLWSESLNRYSYAWNNPLKWVDPSGFQDEGSGIGADPSSSDPVRNVVFDPEVVPVYTYTFDPQLVIVDVDPPQEAPGIPTADDNGTFLAPSNTSTPGGPVTCCGELSNRGAVLAPFSIGGEYAYEYRKDNIIGAEKPGEKIPGHLLAMLALQGDPSTFFPFDVKGLQGEKEITLGHSYNLVNKVGGLLPLPPGESLMGQPYPVQVTQVSGTSFTFTTLPGHFDPIGSTITFTTWVDPESNIHLEQYGRTTQSDHPDEMYFYAPLFAGFSWDIQANNLRNWLRDGEAQQLKFDADFPMFKH
jgi:RHS repeat-associated protein